MKQRCFNTNSKKYPLYGGRGITMCEEWRNDFAAFYAYMGDPPPSTTIDRIDTNKGYEPGNVRWATPKQQANNLRCNVRIALGNKTHTMSEWADLFGCSRDAVKLRLRRGQTIEQVANAFGFQAQQGDT